MKSVQKIVMALILGLMFAGTSFAMKEQELKIEEKKGKKKHHKLKKRYESSDESDSSDSDSDSDGGTTNFFSKKNKQERILIPKDVSTIYMRDSSVGTGDVKSYTDYEVEEKIAKGKCLFSKGKVKYTTNSNEKATATSWPTCNGLVLRDVEVQTKETRHPASGERMLGFNTIEEALAKEDIKKKKIPAVVAMSTKEVVANFGLSVLGTTGAVITFPDVIRYVEKWLNADKSIFLKASKLSQSEVGFQAVVWCVAFVCLCVLAFKCGLSVLKTAFVKKYGFTVGIGIIGLSAACLAFYSKLMNNI